jgi:hypothetical protein
MHFPIFVFALNSSDGQPLGKFVLLYCQSLLVGGTKRLDDFSIPIQFSKT